MHDDLTIILYPDPRLKKVCTPVQNFDEPLRALAARMFELMREAKGVGLAAPQVGRNIRMFVMNATGESGHDRVYVNPMLLDAAGETEAEEGCLSIPGLDVNVLRSQNIRMVAQDLEGRSFEEVASGFVPRVWQHEFDHLNGTLITDRMGPVARLANRKLLKELEEKYAAEHPPAPKAAAKPRRRRAAR